MTDVSATVPATVTLDLTAIEAAIASTPGFAAAVAAILAASATPPPPVVTSPPPVVTPPASDTAWVFHAGRFYWAGDWSAAAVANYGDSANLAPDGTPSLLVTTQQWGLWQPYVSAGCQSSVGMCFDTTPYKYITFSLKTRIASQAIQVGFMSSGDTTDGPVVLSTPYGPAAQSGKWSTYKMPLSVFKLTDTTVLKFWIQDQSGLKANAWNLADVGFTVS